MPIPIIKNLPIKMIKKYWWIIWLIDKMKKLFIKAKILIYEDKNFSTYY